MPAAPTQTIEQPSRPKAIGPYKILDVVGSGGMGVVYRASRARADRDGSEIVALKTVRVPEGSSVASIRAEIVALSRLRHPYIVKILGEGVSDGIPWYAMELLDGVTMRSYHSALWRGFNAGEDGVLPPPGSECATSSLPSPSPGSPDAVTVFAPAASARNGAAASTRRAGPRRPAAAGKLPEVLTVMRRLCAPLAYLHGRGVVHRDLKPGNVHVRPGNQPVLMDFGLASRFRGGVGREALEIGGILVGTAAYMAPEQAMGLLVDARADLYAFGVMLYEMLTGEVPFTGRTTHDLLQQHVSMPPEPPSSLVDGVSERLDALVLRLLAKRPRDRFGYAEDVAAELAELGADLSPEVRSRTYLYRPELSGRDDALSTLESAIERLREGAGARVLVSGESGVGKTSLVARAARSATLARLAVITGECLPIAVASGSAPQDGDNSFGAGAGSRLRLSGAASTFQVAALDVKGAPLHPFQPLLQKIADFCREGGRERTDRLLGRRGKVLSAYEPALLDLPGQSEHPDPVDVAVEAAHQRVLEALAETLSAFVAHIGPVLLIIDDLQWADELSLSFLASLPADYFEHQPLLLFGTYRSDEVAGGLSDLVERCPAARIHLGRLDEKTVGAIVSDMLAFGRPPRPFVHFLAQQSEGNPFFIAEYLRAAVEEGLLVREAGAWRFASEPDKGGGALSATFDALPLPVSLRDLVARRLMGLGEDARALLEVASVLGREVDALVLQKVAGVDEGAMLGTLKELALRQVLLPAGGDRLRFAHDKLREITYGRIPAERRRTIHRAAAEAIERELSSSTHLALHYSELAHHWTAAEAWSKSVRYLEKAGEQALRDFSNQEAVRFFSQALALADRMEEPPGPLQLARWERSLVEAYQGLGEDATGRVHAELALRHCRRPMPTSTAGRVLGFLAQIAIRVAQSWLPPRKVTSPVKRALLLEAAYVSQRMLEPAFRDNDPLLGAYCGVRCLNLAEKVPVSPPLARGYAFMCHVLLITPFEGAARAWSERALRYAEELGSEPLLIYCLSRVGCYSTSVADWQRAESQFRRAIEMAQRLGDRRQMDEALALLGICLHANGRFDESVVIGRKELESGQERGDLQTQGWARNFMAQGLTRLGRPGEALALLARGKGWVEGVAEDSEALWAEAAAALAHFAAGDMEAARRSADSALARLRKRPPAQFYLGASCSELAEIYLALWEDAAGSGRASTLADSARVAVSILARFAKMVRFARPAALRARAEVAWLEGRVGQALRTWRSALAEAERLRMPYQEARAHLDLGLHLESHAEARGHLERAIALLTPLGAAVDLLRARAALEELRG